MIEHFSPQYLTTNCLKNALQIPHRNVNISEACPPRPPILPTNLFQHVSGKVFAKKVKSFPFDENVVPKFSQVYSKAPWKYVPHDFVTQVFVFSRNWIARTSHQGVVQKCFAKMPCDSAVNTVQEHPSRLSCFVRVCHKPVPAQLATVIQNGLPSLYRRSNVQQSHQPYIPTETTIAWIKSQDFTSMRSQLAMCVKALNCCLCGGRH